MTTTTLPLIVNSTTLHPLLGDANLLIIDLCKADVYRQYHLPGAVHLEYSDIIASQKPIMGLLPDDKQLEKVLSAIGIDQTQHVIAYDDEGGGKAARLLWTLQVLGHQHFSLLDGGLHAWTHRQLPLDNSPVMPVARQFSAHRNNDEIVTKEKILADLDNASNTILDCRSPAEFSGEKRFAERGGHIPGAVNWDWMRAIDTNNALQLHPPQKILADLHAHGLEPGTHTIVHCQTHHRSSHTWLVLKSLGFEQVKGYPGSWSEWGNDATVPIES